MNVSLRAFWGCRNWKDSAEQIQHNDMDKLPRIHLGVAIHPPLCLRPDLFVWKVRHLNFLKRPIWSPAFYTYHHLWGHFPQPSNLVILGKAKRMEVPFRAERHHCPFNIFSIWGTLSTQTLKPSEKTGCLLCQLSHRPSQNHEDSELKIITTWKSTTLPHQYQKNVEMWNCENYFFIDAMHVSSLTIGGKLDSFCLTCFILWWGGFLEIFFGWHVGIAGIQKRHYYNLGVTDGHLGVTSRQKKTWGN